MARVPPIEIPVLVTLDLDADLQHDRREALQLLRELVNALRERYGIDSEWETNPKYRRAVAALERQSGLDNPAARIAERLNPS